MAGTNNSWNNQINGSYNQIILNAGTNGVAISTDASAATVNVATGGAVKTTTVGSTSSTSATTVQSGSGALNITATNGALTMNSGTGTLAIANDATAQTVNIATGAGAKLVTLGTTNGASSLALKTGTADFTLASATGTIISALDTGEMTFPLQSAFLATHTSAQNNVTGNGATVTINFTTEIFDQNNDYDGTNTFTAPVTGRYGLRGAVEVSDMSVAATNGFLAFVTSNRTYYFVQGNFGAMMVATFNLCTFNGAILADMDAADTAIIQARVFSMVGNTADIAATPSAIYFGGNLQC